MNALPTIESEDESEPENHSLGRVIFNRIGTLERTRLQTRCLQALSATPVWNQLVFRGGVALHGVYLHGRCSRDLDFLAPAAIQENFMEILAAQGIALEKKEDARVPFFPMQGTVFKEIAVGIDVCPRAASDITWEDALFQGVGNTTMPVRVLPLVHLMAEKFCAASRRASATDFYDIYVFAQKRPDLLTELARVLCIGELSGEKLKFNAEQTWLHFQQVRDVWHEELIPLMPQVPPFETVAHDLAGTLKHFAADFPF